MFPRVSYEFLSCLFVLFFIFLYFFLFQVLGRFGGCLGRCWGGFGDEDGVGAAESRGDDVHFAVLVAHQVAGEKVTHEQGFLVGLAARAKQQDDAQKQCESVWMFHVVLGGCPASQEGSM